MKVISLIPKETCRKCPYNDYRRCGVDFCIRAKCIYKVKLPDIKAESEKE